MSEQAYRNATLLCPGCAEPLRAIPLEEATVDTCDHCGGAWFDWYDGDTQTLAATLQKMSSAAENNPAGGGHQHCPRCDLGLHDEMYQGQGPRVLRCESCAGVFVPREGLQLLASQAEAPPPHEDRSFWSFLWGLLRKAFAQ